MKLDIECQYCNYTVTVEWPEKPPGKLFYVAYTSPKIGLDSGLNSLRLHHDSTKPKIGNHEGMAHGHEVYNFKTKTGISGIIDVTGTIAVITKTD